MKNQEEGIINVNIVALGWFLTGGLRRLNRGKGKLLYMTVVKLIRFSRVFPRFGFTNRFSLTILRAASIFWPSSSVSINLESIESRFISCYRSGYLYNIHNDYTTIFNYNSSQLLRTFTYSYSNNNKYDNTTQNVGYILISWISL